MSSTANPKETNTKDLKKGKEEKVIIPPTTLDVK